MTIKQQLASFLRKIMDNFSWFPFWFQSIGQPDHYSFLVNGVKFLLRKNTSDYFVVDEIFKKFVYGEKPTGIVFDIGANIGAYSLYGAKTARHVFAFEPDSDNYQCLEKNLSLNDFNNISTFRKAVGDTKRNITLYKGRNNKGMASTTLITSNNTEQVEMISLQDAVTLCNVDHIDTLKIDIEGGEYQLIENIPDHLFHKIGFIVMEFHGVSGKSVESLIYKLKQARYDVKVERRFIDNFFGIGIIKARRV